VKPREAAEWLLAWSWLKDRKDAPAVLVTVTAAKNRVALKLATVPHYKPPAKADKGKLLAALERRLEEACKGIVKRRDLKDGWGKCISCPRVSNRLQWGHFIPQHKSAWLRFDPRNTAMQCEACNGFGYGMTFEYGKALNERENDPTFADRLKMEAKAKASWKPTLGALEDKLKELQTQFERTP
jgi:hypothetical protein